MNIKSVCIFVFYFVTTLFSFIPILQAQTLSVKSVKISAGVMSNQSLTTLDQLQQFNNDDDWDSYIEAKPNRKRFSAIFLFNYALSKPSATIEAIHLKVNTIGEDKKTQQWYFQIRNHKTKKWVSLGDNSSAQAWRWNKQEFIMQKNVAQMIAPNGDIQIRYRSKNSTDVSNIDYMVLELAGAQPPSPDPQPTPQPTPDGQWWKPSPGEKLTWQWQLNGTLDSSLNVDVYDIDLFDTSKEKIAELKANGRIVVCYFSAGTYEGWRPDWKTFFPFIKDDFYTGSEPPFAGKMADWDERWLDVREIDLLAPIMRSRLALAKSKGCDAVEPDNVDAYSNYSEVLKPVQYADQINYNRWLADEAHRLGLSIGLKNDVEQLPDLVNDFDWALSEECFFYEECDDYRLFISAGKAVFGVEYQGDEKQFCKQANAMQFSWLKKRLALDAWRIGCESIK